MLHRKHFTLIELLTVIAIMGVLAAILMPALSKARRKAKLTSCMNQLRQIAGLGFAMYMGDNGDHLPLWPSHLFPSYLPDKRTYLCPMDGNDKNTASKDWNQRPTGDLSGVDSQIKVKSTFDREGSVGVHANPNTDVEKISYFYEMSDATCAWSNHGVTGTWYEVKMAQLKQGDDDNKYQHQDIPWEPSVFPIYRCFWHTPNPMKASPSNSRDVPIGNISYAGNFFYSRITWEQGVWRP